MDSSRGVLGPEPFQALVLFKQLHKTGKKCRDFLKVKKVAASRATGSRATIFPALVMRSGPGQPAVSCSVPAKTFLPWYKLLKIMAVV